METLIYIFDLSALATVLYYSYKNDQLKPGEEEKGPFRIKVKNSSAKE